MKEPSKPGKNLSDIQEINISEALDTCGTPDPDLMIRTGGNFRISNFLPWQCAYTEFFVTATLWPDFGPAEFRKALRQYMGTERRFGKR